MGQLRSWHRCLCQIPPRNGKRQKSRQMLRLKTIITSIIACSRRYFHSLAPRCSLCRDEYAETTNADRDNDVHSSCLSPAAEEEDCETPAGIIMPTHAPLSVDDFFDLDEAAEAPSPLVI